MYTAKLLCSMNYKIYQIIFVSKLSVTLQSSMYLLINAILAELENEMLRALLNY